MDELDRTIERFRRQIALRLILKYALASMTLWVLVWGAGVLVLRAVTDLPRVPMLWGGLGLVAGLLMAVPLGLRRRPPRSVLRATLDRRNAWGGVLMAGEEADVTPWRPEMPALRLPRIRWQGQRAFYLFLGALGFLLLSFIIPARLAEETQAAPGLDISRQVAQLIDQIQALQQEKLLEEQRAEQMQEALEQAREEASGEDPVKTWETLDHLAETLRQRAREAAQQSIGSMEQLSQAQALAQALMERAGQFDEQTMTQAMQTLAELAQKAQQSGLGEMMQIDPELLQGLEQGNLTPEQMAELQQQLQQGQQQMSQMMQRLDQARLLDPQSLQQLQAAGQMPNQGSLMAMLQRSGQNRQGQEGSLLPSQGQQPGEGQQPGRGGINRGGGETAMGWGEESEGQNARFQEQTLPPAELAQLKQSQAVGENRTAPTVPEEMAASTGGALEGAQAGPGAAIDQTILPRHRGPVQRYFERDSEATPTP